MTKVIWLLFVNVFAPVHAVVVADELLTLSALQLVTPVLPIFTSAVNDGVLDPFV
jgi:hypothetical protein